jgi:hypothetical protein
MKNVHESYSNGVDIAPVRCRVGHHTEDLTYLYTMISPGLIPPQIVFQCPTSKIRFVFCSNGIDPASVKRSPRPTNGWAPVELEDGRIVTDAGKVAPKDETKAIPDSDPWPADAAREYTKPTRFQGYTADEMGF